MTTDLQVEFALARSLFEIDVRFVAPPGITVLFGPSGSGKSSILDVVAGLLEPARGTIRLGDRTLFDSARDLSLPAKSRGIGYIFQSLALFPHRTVLQNVTYGIAHLDHSTQHSRAVSLLTRLGVESLASRRPGSLSGGERQRVAIARALAIDPSILLLDEPFTALDRARRRDLVNLVRELVTERNIPALFVTHDQEEAEAIADRVVVLKEGRVFAQGAPLDVLDAPERWTLAAIDPDDNCIEATVVEQHSAEGTTDVQIGDAMVHARPSECEPGSVVNLAIRAAEVTISLDSPGRTSASNVLRGTITHIASIARTIRVTIDCGFLLRAEITPAARDRLELQIGSIVWAVFKTRACHLTRTERLSSR